MPIHINWPGYAGRPLTFETYPIGTAFKEIGGVYVFCKPGTNGQWHAIYVGETGNLNERLNTRIQSHQAWSSCLMHGATHIGVLVVGSGLYQRRERLNIETELRHSLNPPCNRQAA